MIKANKSLGQNFLNDNNIVERISDSIIVDNDDLIIEIGPGPGALTKKLVNKGCQLLAFEIDNRMHEFLDQLENDRFKVIYEDILNVDLDKMLSSYSYNNIYVIANLPYYITSPIITKLMMSKIDINKMVIMVQNEVADRLSAEPCTKSYGLMTVFVNAFYDVRKLFVVNRNCFTPSPNVDSAVVLLEKSSSKEIINDVDKFKNLISSSFMHKRKKLRNNLSKDVFEKVSIVLSENGISTDSRPEEIPSEVYIKMSNIL